MNFNNPELIQRYEDLSFELETAIVANIANNQRQNKSGYRFIVDNSGNTTSFDWYRARLSVDFKVTLTPGGDITVDDHNGLVNAAHSLINNLNVIINGNKLYDCNHANHCVNVKNVLDYTPAYVESLATNELFYMDTSRSAEERPALATYNKGFAARKALLGTSSVVSTEIPLNRYSFFESLEDKLLPNTRVELNFEIERDGNIWQAGADCRVIITRMQLILPKITFTPAGQKFYMKTFLEPHKWTYLRENVEISNSMKKRFENFRITVGVSKPRHVFFFYQHCFY